MRTPDYSEGLKISEGSAQRRAFTGKTAEDLACQAYLDQGARLVARNYRLRCGEIDLIFEEPEDKCRESTLVFVEVRARNPALSWETPSESLSASKLQRLRRTANQFLANYKGKATSVRFDLASWDLSSLEILKNFWWY